MTTDADLEGAIADARPEEPAAIALARARIGGALFGNLAPGFGRFRVLERLGEGGMGVVYAAYDPDLDRGVALKMIDVGVADRASALAEAKALAKLSHPHVVPVFDVGLHDGRVFIVMELVRGKTLRAWVDDQPREAVLDAYRQAGAGLAAAHAAGLVHRDFKPDNALVGADGRVKVVDFGLACEAAVATTAGGTPRYMAPEQAAGGAVSPAADQYSFCVALEEALTSCSGGDRPVPRWIAAILERGRAHDPAARFPSIEALVRALGRDPRRVRRRRLAIAAGVVAVGALVFAVRRGSAAPEICSGGDVAIARAWSPAARTIALARLGGLGPHGAELARRYPAELTAWTDRWAGEHQAACLDHRRAVHSEAMFDRRTVCLERARTALSQVAQITTAATPSTIGEVALAVASLPAPEACADVATLTASGPPPPALARGALVPVRDAIERARVLIAAGRFAQARSLVEPALAQARAIGYRPVVAEVLLVDGHAAMAIAEPATAAARLREATTEALAAGAHATAIEAWARRAWIEGTTSTTGDVLAGLDVVEALASSAEGAAFARALLANNLGSVQLARGLRAEARASFARSAALAREVHGPGEVELLFGRTNALVAADDPTQLDDEQHAIIDALAARLGSLHPHVLDLRYIRATTTIADATEARTELEDACASAARSTTAAVRTANCWAELAELRATLGDTRAAHDAGARALATSPDVEIEYPELRGQLAQWSGDDAAAIAALRAARSAAPPSPPTWYERYARAKIELALGESLARTGATDAREVLTSAAATLDEVTREVRASAITRRRDRAHAQLTALR